MCVKRGPHYDHSARLKEALPHTSHAIRDVAVNDCSLRLSADQSLPVWGMVPLAEERNHLLEVLVHVSTPLLDAWVFVCPRHLKSTRVKHGRPCSILHMELLLLFFSNC